MLSLIKSFIIILIFIFTGSKTFALLPSIYSGFSYYNSSINLNGEQDNSSNFSVFLGVRPITSIPIISGFRVEGSYEYGFSSLETNNSYGLGLLYDFNIIPIVTPYVGVSLYQNHFKIKPNGDDIEKTINTTSPSLGFSAGVTLKIPYFPPKVTLNYYYKNSNMFDNYYYNSNGDKYKNNYISQGVQLGVSFRL